jgi:polyketide biosynthesis enoyl-CoA hydratase PksI
LTFFKILTGEHQLKRRGINVPVVRRIEVLDEALRLARELATKPRPALILLKRELTRKIDQQLSETIQAELAMHHAMLMDPTVKQQVRTLFGN